MNSSTVLVLAGTTGVALGLIQSELPKFSDSLTRFVASILFVMGTSLMLTSIDAVANNIFIDLFCVSQCAVDYNEDKPPTKRS